MSSLHDSDYDLTRIIVRPLYFGLFANIVLPMALLLIIYYVNNNQGWRSLVSDEMAETLFWVFAGLAVVHVGLVIIWRKKLYAAPMISQKENFESNFADEYLRRTRPLFMAIGAVALYGFIFYFVTGRFNEALMFVVFSFLVFQIVRPRYGLVQKLIDQQKVLVDRGEFKK